MATAVENSTNSLAPNVVKHIPDDIPNDGTGTCADLYFASSQNLTQCEGVVKLDPWLEPFAGALKRRYSKAQAWVKTLNDTEGGLEKFSRVGTSEDRCIDPY